MSRTDLLVNQAVYFIFLTDVVLVTISTLLLMNWEKVNFALSAYLGYKTTGVTSQDAIDSVPDGMVWQTSKTSFVTGWLTYIVLYNNFIPISMYVTLEVITFVNLFYINEDVKMYHKDTDTPAKARSNNITDLGQIEYVFTDKTGTLTQNVMKFRRCSVGGRIYGAPVMMTELNAVTPYVNLSQVT